MDPHYAAFRETFQPRSEPSKPDPTREGRHGNLDSLDVQNIILNLIAHTLKHGLATRTLLYFATLARSSRS